jgi:hypothetical protein
MVKFGPTCIFTPMPAAWQKMAHIQPPIYTLDPKIIHFYVEVLYA